MAEQLLTGQPTPPTGPLPLTYQNLFNEATKVSQRKDVPLPNGKYAANAKDLETYLQTPENQEAFYKGYSKATMMFGPDVSRTVENFKAKISGGLTSGEIAMQKAKPSLPTVKPVTQVQQMEYQDLNQPAIEQFESLKANKINKTAAGKELKTYQEMQDYFSSPENVSDWGKAYNYTIKTKGFDLNTVANNTKPKQSLKTITEIQTDAAEQIQRDDLDQVDPDKLSELVYNAEELGIVGEAIDLKTPIELTEYVDGQFVTRQIDKLTYDDYNQLLKYKYGKSDVNTSLIQPGQDFNAGYLAGDKNIVYSVNEFEEAKGKVKENYLNNLAIKNADEKRTKNKNYDADIETKNRQLLSPDEQKLAQVTDQIDQLVDQMLIDKYSGKGVSPDFQVKLRGLEQQAAQFRKASGLASDQMFDSVTGQMVDTTPEEKQAIQIGAQKAQEKYSTLSSRDQLKAERNLLWEKVQLLDEQINSVKNEWRNTEIPGSTTIGFAQQALGIEGGVTGKSAQLYSLALNLQNKKAELYGQLLTLNKLVYTNEDLFKRETEYGVKAAAESVAEDTYGFKLFTDENTVRTRVQEVEEAKRFFDSKGIKLSNKQLLGTEAGILEGVGAGVGTMVNAMVDIGISSYGIGLLAKGLSGSKYWQVAKEFMSNKYGAAGRFATSMTEGALPYLVQGTAYDIAGQSFGTGVAETVAEKAFDKYAAQGIEKFGGKYGKITFILGRWLSGATGETVAEVAGNIIPLLAENGFDVNKAYTDAFGETGDERTKNLAKLGLSCVLFAAPANLGYVFKTGQTIKREIAENGSNPILEEVSRVIDDTIQNMPTGQAATNLDERIYGENPVMPLVFTEAPEVIVNEDLVEPPVQGPAERPQETVGVEKRSANNGEEFFVVENDGKVNKNVVYRVNANNGQLEVKGYDAMQEGFVPASETIVQAVDRKSKENGIISSDKATRVAKQRLNIDPDAERVITPEGKVLYQTPGQTAQQFGKTREKNTNKVRVTADNTFAFLNGLKEKIITNIFPEAETKVDEEQSSNYNRYRDAVRSKMKLNAGSFFSKGKAVLMESGMNKIPKVADFLAALMEDFAKTGKSIEIAAGSVAETTTKVALKIEDVVNDIVSTDFFQEKFGSVAEASDYAKNLLTDLMINDKSVAKEIFGENKEAYNKFISFREGFNKFVAKNYTGKTAGYTTDHKFYNSQMPDVTRRAREEEFQMEKSKQLEEEARRDDVANVLNLAGIETSVQNIEGARYKQGEISASQYLDTLGEDIDGLTNEEITAKADVASENINIENFNEAVKNRKINEETRKKRQARLRKELKTKFQFNNPLAKLVSKDALKNIKSMRGKRAAVALIINKVVETAATRAGVTADEFLDNYLQFEKATEQEFMDFVKNQPGGKELFQRIGEMGAQYSNQVAINLNTAKKLELEGESNMDIAMATGWSRGFDGNWKYAMIPKSADLKVEAIVNVAEGDSKIMPLGSILKWPELFSKYPGLETADLVFVNNPNDKTSGSYSDGIITMNLARASSLFDFQSTLQHEVQHAIQHLEGWQYGGSPNYVPLADTLDVVESIAEAYRNAGRPISDIAVKEATRLMYEFGYQLQYAKPADFQELLQIIQQNLWDAQHSKLSEDFVKEFTQKFPINISNEVIDILSQATNYELYNNLYGELEANLTASNYESLNRLMRAMLIDPNILEKMVSPENVELAKEYAKTYTGLVDEYNKFKETAKVVLSEISNNPILTERQRDILREQFNKKTDTVDNYSFALPLLYTELSNNPNFPKEQLDSILDVLKIQSDYSTKAAQTKLDLLKLNKNTIATGDEIDMMDANPLFWSSAREGRAIVPKSKYNPKNFNRTQKQYNEEKEQLLKASEAVQDFKPTGSKYDEIKRNEFNDDYILSDNENDWRDGEFISMASISNRKREQYIETLKKKRPDLVERGEVENVLDEIEKFIDQNTAPGKINSKLEKLTMYWVANGNVILPEDGYKIIEAERVANLKKIDPFTFKNPTELINKYQAEVKGKKITLDEIDKMPEFSDKTTIAPEIGGSDKITIYTVEDTREGQAAVRKIIDSHFGEDANPWCLAARIDGNLDAGWGFWSRTYNAYPKKIAFRNGKLVAFSANSDSDIVWWDRNDEPQIGIESSIDLGDNKKQKIHIKEDGSYEGGDITRTITSKDNEGNKIETLEVFDEFGKKVSLNRRKNGKLDGEQIEYLENGNIFTKESFKDGLRDGPTTDYYPDGNVNREEYYKDGKKEGNQQSYYTNGELKIEEYYKDGKQEGVQREYHQNGNTRVEEYYKDGKQEGVQRVFFEGGQIEWETSYKNGERDGFLKNYSYDGQIKEERNFKNGKLDGVQKIYYPDGTLDEEQNYKNGRKDGVQTRYFVNGRIELEENYKDGFKHGIERKYSVSDNSYVEKEYRDNLLVGSKLEKLLGKDNLLMQGNRGAAFITQDAADIIFALTDPNLSTPLHEIAHIYEKYMTDAERKTVLGITGESEWSTNTSEYFARGFERYLYGGNAPDAKLLQVFDKLRTWLKDIYTQLSGSEIDVVLNQPMRDLYAAMLGEAKAPEVQVTETQGPKTADAELADFIQSKKDQGISDDQIYTGLLQSGFKAADLEDFFNLRTRQTVASQIEENGPVKDEARIAADEAAGMYVRRTAEELEREMDSLTSEEAFSIIEYISQGNADAAISLAIQNILAKKALGENVQKDFDKLIEAGTNLGRALQAFTKLKNQSGALRARNIINKLATDKKKLPTVIKEKLIELGDRYDQAKINLNNAKDAAMANPLGQSAKLGKSNIDYFQEKLKEFNEVGKEFSKAVRPYTSKVSITDTAGTILRGNLLTPSSTIINITANTAKTVFNIPINLTASLVSQVAELAGGTKGTMRGWDYYTKNWSYKLQGFKKAGEILREGNVPDTSKGLQTDSNFNGFKSLSEMLGFAYGKIIDKKSDEELATEYGYSLNEAGKIPKKEVFIKTIEGTFGFPAEVFFRILGAGDAVFRNVAYYSALTEQAKLAGITDPKDIENFIILNSDYSNTKADNEALRFVYSNNSRIYKGVSQVYGSGTDAPGKIWKLFATGIIPYAKIPTNVIIEFADIMIPELSFAKAGYYAYQLNNLSQKQKATRNPQEKLKLESQKQDLARKRDEMVGRAVVGTAMTFFSQWIAQSGALSGGAQGEDKKRKDFQYRFESPYRMNISLLERYLKGDTSGLWKAGDRTEDYRYLGIMGGMFFAAEQNRKAQAKEGKGKPVNQSVFSTVGDFMSSRANNLGATLMYLIDQSFLRGASQLFAVFNPTQEGASERLVAGFFTTYSSILVPNFMSIYDKANRKYIPEYDSPYEGVDKMYYDFMAKLNERIPGNPNTTAKVDLFGRPIPQTPVGRNPWLYNSIDVTKESTGLYDDENMRWEDYVYLLNKKGDIAASIPQSPSPYIKTIVGGEKYALSPEQYEKYAIAIGDARRKIVDRFIRNGKAGILLNPKSSINTWPDGRPKTVDNEGHLLGHMLAGEILSSLYAAADATMINAQRGVVYEARKKMAIERPEQYKELIEREKNNIYSRAIDILYDNPATVKYLPKTTAMDIFFSKRVKYEPDNRSYENVQDETQQPPATQGGVDDETKRWIEYLEKQKNK